VELVIWQRSIDPELSGWLAGLAPHQLPNERLLVEEAHLSRALTSVLDASGMPPGDMRTAFLDDVLALATSFMAAMGIRIVDIRLEAVQQNACWKFHRDCVPVRLLTTYRGPGTEWVLPCDSGAALSQQTSYGGPIQHFSHQAVGVFKGTCAHPASGVVHRSPRIAGTGMTRLLLCLNLPFAASPALWKLPS